MRQGPYTHQLLARPSVVEIRSEGPFTVFALINGERTRIIGPDQAGSRRLKFVIDYPNDGYEVTCAEENYWSFDVSAMPSRAEVPDTTPVEIPTHAQKPESLTDIMSRMISEKFLEMNRSEGTETFEEADDFDIDDDELVSPYEMQELTDEYPIPSSEPVGAPTRDDRTATEGEPNPSPAEPPQSAPEAATG